MNSTDIEHDSDYWMISNFPERIWDANPFPQVITCEIKLCLFSQSGEKLRDAGPYRVVVEARSAEEAGMKIKSRAVEMLHEDFPGAIVY